MTDRIDGRPRPQRETTEVELFETDVGDQFLEVANKNIRGIVRRIVRLSAQPVGTKVGHDHSKALVRDPLRMAELDPVHLRIGKQSMQQDHWPARAKLVIGEFDAVGGVPSLNDRIGHAECDVSRSRPLQLASVRAPFGAE